MIIWCPGHIGLDGNERADGAARAFVNRAADHSSEKPFLPRDILEYQRRERRKYSVPHPDLSGRDSYDWRRIQTHTYPNLYLKHAIHPTFYSAHWPWCGGRPTLAHITWDCQNRPPKINTPLIAGKLSGKKQWETWLASEDREMQLALLDQARRTAQASGALD